MKTTKKLTTTDVKYKILTSLKELDLPLDTPVTVTFEGRSFAAKTHSSAKGRIDRLGAMYKDSGLSEDDVLNISYDAGTNTVAVVRADGSAAQTAQPEKQTSTDAAAPADPQSVLPLPLTDPEQNFAYHKEYRHYSLGHDPFEYTPSRFRIFIRTAYGILDNDYDNYSPPRGSVYEMRSDGTGRVITSKDRHFEGDLAVNRHGIFRIINNNSYSGSKGLGIYLFDFDGKPVSSFYSAKPLDYYIYDNKIVVYDIYGKQPPENIWSLEYNKDFICGSLAARYSKISKIDFYKTKVRGGKIKIYVNDKRVILSIGYPDSFFSIKLSGYGLGRSVIIDIDLKTRKPAVIHDRDRFNIEYFDMARNTVWVTERNKTYKETILFEFPIANVIGTSGNPEHDSLRSYNLGYDSCAFSDSYFDGDYFVSLYGDYFSGYIIPFGESISDPDGVCISQFRQDKRLYGVDKGYLFKWGDNGKYCLMHFSKETGKLEIDHEAEWTPSKCYLQE